MKKKMLLLITLHSMIFSSLLLIGQEKINLGTPIVPVTITDLTPKSLYISPQLTTPVIQAATIHIELFRTDGTVMAFDYPCTNGCTAMDTAAEVQTAILALNGSANMATRSLWRRIMDRLCADFPERFNGGCTVA